MTQSLSQVSLAALPAGAQQQVRHAIACLETTSEPLEARHYPALLDPALRRTVELCLDLAGRALIARPDGTYLSGFADDICSQLAADGIGVLPPVERAVLALVLLLSVAVPRASGVNSGTGWTDGEPVRKANLHKCRIPDTRVDTAVTRLRYLGLIAYGEKKHIVGGPQLDRLTPVQSQRLWEDLILIAAPHSMDAAVIRRRRERNFGAIA